MKNQLIQRLKNLTKLQRIGAAAGMVILAFIIIATSSLTTHSAKIKPKKHTELRSVALVQQIISESHIMTVKENAASARLWTCGDLYRATSDFDVLAAQRSNLVSRAQMITFKRNEKANNAVFSLVSYLDYTSQADGRYVAWGRTANQSCNWSHPGYRVSAGNPVQASELKSLANAEKLKFISLWNEFAISNGVPLVGISDL